MKWNDWLTHYHKKYQYAFLTQKLDDFPHPWLNYGTKEYNNFIKKNNYVTQREVFHDEIIYDIDMDKSLHPSVAVAEAKKIAEEISSRLKTLGYTHQVWASGGTGYHIHLFFPELFNYTSLDKKIMTKVILRETSHGYLRPREAPGRIQLQTNTLIQIEDSKHRKGGRKRLQWEHKTGQPNLFKGLFEKAFEEEKNKNNLFKRYYKQYDTETKPMAITYLENEEFHNHKDGRDRAMFVLASFYRQFMEGDELFKKLDEWNNRVLKGYFPKKTIRAKVKSARPCLPMNYIIELFDELGISERYISDLKATNGEKNVV